MNIEQLRDLDKTLVIQGNDKPLAVLLRYEQFMAMQDRLKGEELLFVLCGLTNEAHHVLPADFSDVALCINAALISAPEPVNSALHFSHTASTDGVRFTMRSLRLALPQVYRRREEVVASCGFQMAPLPFFSRVDVRGASRAAGSRGSGP